MVVHYSRTVWKICYAEHKETGKTSLSPLSAQLEAVQQTPGSYLVLVAYSRTTSTITDVADGSDGSDSDGTLQVGTKNWIPKGCSHRHPFGLTMLCMNSFKSHRLNSEGAKNSSGKKAGLLPATGKHRYTPVGRLLITVYFCLTSTLMTSGNYAGLRPLCAPDQNQEPIHLCLPVAGSRPALFPPLFFAPALLANPNYASRGGNNLSLWFRAIDKIRNW